MQSKSIEWVLRISVAGEFLGHGIFGLIGKEEWIGWIIQMTGVSPDIATKMLLFIGMLDIYVALIVLIRPVRVVLLWATFWGFWTAFLRLLVGLPIMDFVERSANWGAPLALLLLIGWPKSWKEWLS